MAHTKKIKESELLRESKEFWQLAGFQSWEDHIEYIKKNLEKINLRLNKYH